MRVYTWGRVFIFRGRNMKKTAILLDGGFVLQRIKSLCNLRQYPEADAVYDFAMQLKGNDEDIFRIYFYHGEPYKGKTSKPISGSDYDFSRNSLVTYSERLFKELSHKDFIAIRKGETVFRGWKIKEQTINVLKTQNHQLPSLVDYDFEPDLTQKGVDLKIGLDVAWLASRQIADRVVLVTGDSDFIPAMKFARKEGIQVVLAKVGNNNIKESLYEHSDLVRSINYQNGSWMTNEALVTTV
jgi:uncharacterized LabA/DUF88 family protein